MLTSLLLFGEAHFTSLYPHEEDKKRIDFLTKSSLKLKYLDEGGEGSNCPYQIEALLAYCYLTLFFRVRPKMGSTAMNSQWLFCLLGG